MVPVTSVGGNGTFVPKTTLGGIFSKLAYEVVAAILLPRCKSLVYIVLAGNIAMLRKAGRNDL